MSGVRDLCGLDARPVVIGDVPFLIELARRRYPDWEVPARQASEFLCQAMMSPTSFVWRTRRAAIAASMVVWFFLPREPQATMLFLAAETGAHWEAVHLLELAAAWAHGGGAAKFCFGAETSADFGVFAKWLRHRGWRVYQDKPTYTVRL